MILTKVCVWFLFIFLLAQICPSAYAREVSSTMSEKGRKLATASEVDQTQQYVKSNKAEAAAAATTTTEDPFSFGNDIDSG